MSIFVVNDPVIVHYKNTVVKFQRQYYNTRRPQPTTFEHISFVTYATRYQCFIKFFFNHIAEKFIQPYLAHEHVHLLIFVNYRLTTKVEYPFASYRFHFTFDITIASMSTKIDRLIMITDDEKLAGELRNVLQLESLLLQHKNLYPDWFRSAFLQFMVRELFSRQAKNLQLQTLFEIKEYPFTKTLHQKYPTRQVNWCALLKGGVEFHTAMSKLLNCAWANRKEGTFSANNIQVATFEQQQQYALNAKHGKRHVNNENGIVDNIVLPLKLPTSSEQILGGDITYYINGYNICGGGGAGEQQPYQYKEKEICEINGAFTFNFLQSITVKNCLVIVKYRSVAKPRRFYCNIIVHKDDREELFNNLDNSDAYNDTQRGYPSATIFWIKPFNLLKSSDNDAIHNEVVCKFMESSGNHNPIPRNADQEYQLKLIHIHVMRASLNNGKNFENNALLSGPLTNVASVRPLEGATDSRALNKEFNVDTVVESTILNTIYSIPEDKIYI